MCVHFYLVPCPYHGAQPQACVISSVLSSFCCFLSFVIYAGVYNTNKLDSMGSFGGGFGLILWGAWASAGCLFFRWWRVHGAV